jgi:diguanylate cyclase (GGDEF)-like protein
MKILLVEDDQTTGEFLTSVLTAHRYTVDLASDGQTGLELATLWKYDLILLDVELPRLDGISVCRELRSQEHTTPILMLTAKNLNHDVVTGLDAGADDYLIKPCDSSQLLARIRALLRRSGGVTAPLLTWGELCLDPAAAQVTFREQTVLLGPKEYNLLELFLRNPQRIFNRSAVLDNLWTADDFPTENAVTNLIKDLRRKLKAAGMTEDLIETIYGLGYRLKVEPDPPGEGALEGTEESAQVRQAAGVATINQLAEQFRASLEQRLASLVSAVRSLQQDELPPTQRAEARQDAHRLAGALGMFGYSQGTDTARAVEQLLLAVSPTTAQIVQALDLLATLQQAIAHPTPATPRVQAHPSGPQRVLLIDAGSEWLETLQQDSRNCPQLRLQRVTPEKLKLDKLTEPPLVFLVTWQQPVPSQADVGLIELLCERFPTVPLLVLATQDTLINRVTAAQLGCQRFLCQPQQPEWVWDAIAQVTQCALSQKHQQHLSATVMVVDDDPILVSTMTALLHPWGLKVIGVVDPEQFWDVLTQTHPDLLILDLNLPTFSGIDLCRVVRQDPFYHHLPIVVITAHRDAIQVQQVFDAGADDLTYKPIVGSELVTRIINRIERARLRQQLDQMQQQQRETLQQESRLDTLTQIANRRRFDEFLAREWHYHGQAQINLSLILCDVDYFKQFNDRYGHLAGDSCLKQIAQVLQSCINPTVDLVARYGGEEFGIILPNTDLNGALRVVRRIQQAIAGLAIPHSESQVHPCLTLSMGITGTIPTPDQPMQALIATADAALYAAKERGRNTYCLYPL